MTVVFKLPTSTASDRDVFAVGCSPLAEASFSLRVLVSPSGFRAHAGWVRSCRHLPTELRRELRELTPIFAHSVPGFLTATTAASSSYADELARVATMRTDEARGEVLAVLETWTSIHGRRAGSSATSSVASAVSTEMRSRAEELRVEWEKHPRDALDRLVALFDRYWWAAFRSEWGRLMPLLLSELRTCAERVRVGLEFAPKSGIHLRDHSVTVRTACRHIERVVPAGVQVTLSPSSFLWPRVSVESSPPWPFAVFYPLPRNRQRLRLSVAEDDLLPSLRALADGTRLTIIRLIIERPLSTQELAELVAMSEAAVSQHLRQLRAAGLVTTKREGHYVLYSAERRSLGRLATALADLTHDDLRNAY
jgi:DNA-binding transcriptional ArsR family regulator